MSVTRIKEWIVGETLTAADLNAEFDNQNGTGVAFPLTENVSCAGYEVSNAKLTTLKQLTNNVVAIDNYTDLADAITSIGSSTTTLLINKNVNVTASATVPSTLTLWFVGQGKLTISSTYTVTINGPVVADPRQIFAGAGTAAGFGLTPVYPDWWGANTTPGTTDMTAAIDAAFDSGAAVVKFVPATYMASTLTIASSVSLIGISQEATLKQIASTSGHFITVSGTSVVVQVQGLTIDGNKANQTAESSNNGIRFSAVGTATVPAALIVEGNTFLNGNMADIKVSTDSGLSTNEYVIIRGNRFLGGAEGQSVGHDPRYVDISSPVNYIISDNLYDFMGTPSSLGRAGIATYDGHSAASTDKGRGVISGNFFSRVGRSHASSTLGCIDLYNYGRSVTVTGNTLVDCYGRGIDSKADCENLAIVGNVIDGLSGLGGADPGGMIAINTSIDANARGMVIVQGNSLYNTSYDGIIYTGSNSGTTDYARAISISGNVLKTITRRGISVVTVDDAVINGNVIDGAETGIHCGSIQESVVINGNRVTDTTLNGINIDSASTAAWINITGNHVQDTGGRGIMVDSAAAGLVVGNTIKNSTSAAIDTQDIGGAFLVADNVTDSSIPYSKSGTNSGLRVQHNMFVTAMGGSTRELTISTGAVTAFADWHTVDTESDAATDDLDTINGGFDGAVVTFRAINGARDVVFKDGSGNMKLSGDFTLNNVEDTITLRYMSGTWYELSRSDNGA